MSTCQFCGKPMKDTAMFCIYCGKKRMEAPAAQPLRCPSCGAVCRPGSKFCTQCGASLQPVYTEEPEEVTELVLPEEPEEVTELTPPEDTEAAEEYTEMPEEPVSPRCIEEPGDTKTLERPGAAGPSELRCPSCNGLCKPGNRFCTRCGASLEAAQPASDGWAPRPAPEEPPIWEREFVPPEPDAWPDTAGGERQQSWNPPPAPPVPNQGGGNRPGNGGKNVLWIVLVLLAVAVIVAAGVGIYRLTQSGLLSGSDSAQTDLVDGEETGAEESEETDASAGDTADATEGNSVEEDTTEDAAGTVSLSVRPVSVVVTEGASVELTAEGAEGTVTWTVADSTVVRLASSTGDTVELTALSEGSTTVTAASGDVSAQCIISVLAIETEKAAESADTDLDTPTVSELDEDDYILPTDTRIIQERELYGLTQEEVALARNEIYARHGYVFTTEAYAEYFESKSWYTPDPSFDALDASQLSDIELANIDVIVNYEESMGWR